MAIDWINKYSSVSYMSSCLYASHLFVGYMTTSSSIAIDYLWTETGTKPISFPISFSSNTGYIQSLRSAGEAGIYGLLKNKITDPEEFTLVLWEVNSDNTLSEISSISIKNYEFLKLESPSDVGIPPYNLEDKIYELTQLFLYYPNGEVEYEPPGIILAGQLDPTKNIGLLMFTYKKDSSKKYYYNPFADSSGLLPSGKHLACDSSKPHYFASEFSCTTGVPPTTMKYYNTGKNNVYHLCHKTCRSGSCSGPLRNHCTECKPTGKYSSLLGQCMESSSGFKFGQKFENGPTYAFNLEKDFKYSFTGYVENTETYYEKGCIRSVYSRNI